MKISLLLVPLLLSLRLGAFAGEVEKGPAAPSSVPTIAAPVNPAATSGLAAGVAGPAMSATAAASIEEVRAVEAGAQAAASPMATAERGEAVSAGLVQQADTASQTPPVSAQASGEAQGEEASAEGRVIFDQAARREGDAVSAPLFGADARQSGLSAHRDGKAPAPAQAAAAASKQILTGGQGEKAGPTLARTVFAAFNGLVAAAIAPLQLSTAAPGQFGAGALGVFSVLFGLGAFVVVRGGLKTAGTVAAGVLASVFPAALGAVVFGRGLELGGASVADQSLYLAAIVGAAAGAATLTLTLGSAFSDRLAKSGLARLKPSALDAKLIFAQIAAYGAAASAVIVSSPAAAASAAFTLQTSGAWLAAQAIGGALAGLLALATYMPVMMAGVTVTVEIAAGLRWMNAALGRLKARLTGGA